MSDLKYLETKEIPANKLNNLFTRVGWRPYFPETWKKIINQSLFIVSAWKEKELIGMGGLFLEEEKPVLYDLSVDPDFRNQGIGERIIMIVEKKASDLGYKTIFTDTSLTNMQKYFEEKGYVEVKQEMIRGELTFFYKKQL